MTLLDSTGLWARRRTLSSEGRRKLAAVAYVTSDEDIVFSSGDTLVLDASDASIANGRTDARVIERAFERGAELYSLKDLHAKVIVFESEVSVGSANISWKSANVLVEAEWLTNDPVAVGEAVRFLHGLVAMSVPIDAEFVSRILQIEVRPQDNSYLGPRSYRRRYPHPVLLFFREVLPGDVRKFQRTASDAGSGGGARDLRVSPQLVFEPVLRQMFPFETDEDGVTRGDITWTTDAGQDVSVPVRLWRPTGARSNELRIGQFYAVDAWHIDEEQYLEERANGLRWFFVLELGASGIVTPRLLQQQHLDLEDPLVSVHVRRQIERTPPNQAVRGAVDLQERRVIGV